ncbi:MAG: hypothetical protein WA971_02470 [Microbacterium sp.]
MGSEGGERVVLLLQGDDFDGLSAWFCWWLNEPEAEPETWFAFEDAAAALRRLDDALPTPRAGERMEAALGRAFDGALAHPERERALMADLAGFLIPDFVIAQIRAHRLAGREVELRIMPPPSCVRVPWALLVVGGEDEGEGGGEGVRGSRLGELVTVIDDVPAAFHVGRARVAAEEPAGPLVAVIDPALDIPRMRLFTDDQRRSLAVPGADEPGARMTAARLSQQLRRTPPSGFVFVGHVAGDAGSTAMHLSPAEATPELPSSAVAGLLTAADLVLGMSDSGGPTGAEIWPMPASVAIVACNSGGDLGRREPFGLVISCLNAGAQWALATRWVLPTDSTFRWFAASRASRSGGGGAFRTSVAVGPGAAEPLAEVARAAIAAVTDGEGSSRITAFLRERIRLWDAVSADVPPSERIALSPLTWGALAVFHAAERIVQPAP